jgi:tungstate transport system ATP-binding protein
MALIETINLGQSYDGTNVLRNIMLEINRGDVFALIGPTGAGKTTLLRALDLLEVPSAGNIYFDSMDVTHSGHLRQQARRRMSFVQQNPVVFTMNVYDNVAYGLRLRHVKNKTVMREVENALELVGMADYRDRHAKTLSGGETQRVAIARSLVTEPEVLFLDEPTANLDPVSTSKVEEILTHIIKEQRTTVVMTTHNMSQGQRLAGRIGVLMNGEMLQTGNPNEIFCSPSSREVAEFVGVENILGGTVIQKEDNLATIAVNGKRIEAIWDGEVDDSVFVIIRPEDITFTLVRGKSSARNVFEGRITRINPVGTLVRIEVDCGFPLLGVLTVRSSQELDFDVGKSIFASFKVTALHVIKRWD